MAGRKPVKGVFMSNEVSVQDKMAAIHQRMLNTIIFLVIGWAVLILPFAFLEGNWRHLCFFAFLIAPAPMLGRILGGGFGAMFNLPEYTVITTYSDGRKESDYGATSAGINLFIKAILLFIAIVIGFIATAIYLVILLIKYIALYTQASPKPAFVKTAFFLLIIGVFSLFGVVLVGGIGQRVKVGVRVGAFSTEHSVFLNAIKNAERENMTAYTIVPPGKSTSTVSMVMYDSEGIYRPKEIPIGEAVTIIGSADEYFQVPVIHEDDRGTIRVEFLSLDPPNQ
jgi:hypothetical protein